MKFHQNMLNAQNNHYVINVRYANLKKYEGSIKDNFDFETARSIERIWFIKIKIY